MTKNEEKIIERIGNLSGDYKCYDEKLTHEEALVLDQLLTKTQEYDNTGTTEDFKRLKAKETPKHVKNIHKSQNPDENEFYGDNVIFGYCPECGELLCSLWNENNCGDCGQTLIWLRKV